MKKSLTLHNLLEILRVDHGQLNVHVYAPYDLGAITIARILRDPLESDPKLKAIKFQNMSRYWDCKVQTLYVDANFVRIELFTDEVLEIYNLELDEMFSKGAHHEAERPQATD